MTTSYWDALDAHLKKEFNIQVLDQGDRYNSDKLIFWGHYCTEAGMNGEEGVRRCARTFLEKFGVEREPEDGKVVTAAIRNVGREMAQSVLDFKMIP